MIHHHIANLTSSFFLISQVNIDFETEPIGTGKNGKEVFLRDIWPTTEEIAEVCTQLTTREQNFPLVQDYKSSLSTYGSGGSIECFARHVPSNI